jgi:hypothetical protein
MSVVRRAAIGALAALALVIAGPALSANAAHKPYHFQTLASINGAHVQACRIPTKASKPVTIKIRVNANKASGKVNGVGDATHNGTRVGKQWTSGWVHKGHVSSVGTVKVARGATYALDAGIGTGAMGNGGSFKTSAIRTCG